VNNDDHVDAARAVYDASTDRYVEFVGTEISPATEAPVDQAMLNAFADLVGSGPSRRVADIGCGTGRATAFLARRDLDVVGFDVSTAMLDAARIAHPDLRFEQGRLTAVPVDDASLGGVVCWYSIIHTPPDRLGDVFSEVGRVLEPGGHLLLGFQAGSGDPILRADAYGTAFSLTSFRHRPDDVGRRLEHAGLEIHASALRQPGLAHEQSPQAFVIARRPGA
jgi:SAM-dependent methyltransferase